MRADAQQAADQRLFKQALAAYGGYSGLARQLKLPLTTVHGWRCRQSIPPWRLDKIRRLRKMRDNRQGQGTRKRRAN